MYKGKRPAAVRQGQIYDIDLPAGKGSVQSGYRPVVITSANRQNSKSPTVIVAVVTSRIKRPGLAEHVVLPMIDGLPKRSIPKLDRPDEAIITRIAGSNRYATSIEAANHLKEKNGIEKFESIIIASGDDFPDALSASYLAYKKDGPILLVGKNSVGLIADYVNDNLATGGKVYIVGGTGAVPQALDDRIKAAFGGDAIVRLAGSNRYATNLMVLKEAGVEGEDMLVASGTGFADALSASAAKRPILLVGKTLSADQAKFLSDNAVGLTGSYYIIGGEGAVFPAVENAVKEYGTVKRLAGSNRYSTSIAVAEQFFPYAVDTVVIANGMNFPDGLSGGPIAAAYDAPLILVVDKTYGHAADFFAEKEAFRLIVMGGTGVIADSTAGKITGGTV